MRKSGILHIKILALLLTCCILRVAGQNKVDTLWIYDIPIVAVSDSSWSVENIRDGLVDMTTSNCKVKYRSADPSIQGDILIQFLNGKPAASNYKYRKGWGYVKQQYGAYTGYKVILPTSRRKHSMVQNQEVFTTEISDRIRLRITFTSFAVPSSVRQLHISFDAFCLSFFQRNDLNLRNFLPPYGPLASRGYSSVNISGHRLDFQLDTNWVSMIDSLTNTLVLTQKNGFLANIDIIIAFREPGNKSLPAGAIRTVPTIRILAYGQHKFSYYPSMHEITCRDVITSGPLQNYEVVVYLYATCGSGEPNEHYMLAALNLMSNIINAKNSAIVQRTTGVSVLYTSSDSIVSKNYVKPLYIKKSDDLYADPTQSTDPNTLPYPPYPNMYYKKRTTGTEKLAKEGL